MSKRVNQMIFGLESSCDETSAAIIKTDGRAFKILANIVFSQIEIHKKYGGVVPEVAARCHIKNILPVVSQALMKAKIRPKQIDKIAVTTGPGLITSLLVGSETAKTLAYVWQKPIVPVNHLKAHVYANWINHETWNIEHKAKIEFPAICLLVSGGHTELILLSKRGDVTAPTFKKVGQTLDDAAGEVAQLLKIGYPGGPIISKMAKSGNTKAFKFARPMINQNNFDFSFSGLKTSVLYTTQKLKTINYKLKTDICASFQQAATDVLVAKTIKAAKRYNAKTVMLSGGVAANELLRQTFKLKTKNYQLGFTMPLSTLCTDNAAMVAAAGYFEKPIPWQKIKVDPNWELS
jgi:N6-L-threonylcarbamoyladenine synthase